MSIDKDSSILIVGAAAFGNSTALHLARRGFTNITVFDRQPYDVNHFDSVHGSADAASTDLNKIVRFTHYDDLHRSFALKTIKEWENWNELYSNSDLPEGLDGKGKLYNKVGYLRYHTTPWEKQPAEVENFENFEKLGLSWTQFDINNEHDKFRAEISGFGKKFDALKLAGKKENGKPIIGNLDITTGFAYASKATYFAYHLAKTAGVKYILGKKGEFEKFIKDGEDVKGIVTADGEEHKADIVIVAAGAWTSSLVPELSPIQQADSGNILLIKIPPERKDLLKKYSIENFPVVAWKQYDHRFEGGGVFFFPITDNGYLKFGARHTRWINNVNGVSVPITESSNVLDVPKDAFKTVTDFISTYLPDIAEAKLPFEKLRLCWYGESINEDFIIDRVPGNNNLLVVAGDSGHGFKFIPTIGEVTADILEGRETELTKRFKWRSAKDFPEEAELFKKDFENLDLTKNDILGADPNYFTK